MQQSCDPPGPIPSIAAGQLDRGKHVGIKIDHGLQRVRSCRAVKYVGQCFEPAGIGRLQHLGYKTLAVTSLRRVSGGMVAADRRPRDDSAMAGGQVDSASMAL
jgi:hypothetical protein